MANFKLLNACICLLQLSCEPEEMNCKLKVEGKGGLKPLGSALVEGN